MFWRPMPLLVSIEAKQGGLGGLCRGSSQGEKHGDFRGPCRGLGKGEKPGGLGGHAVV